MNDQLSNIPVDEWFEWTRQVMQPAAFKHFWIIIALGALALGIVTLLRAFIGNRPDADGAQSSEQTQDSGSVETEASFFFGYRGYDGVLFPIIWLMFTYLAMRIMQIPVKSSLFRVALPLILALVVIRTVVKIMHRVLGDRRWVRVLEQTVSWVVWICVALWATGLLPGLLAFLDGVKIQFGTINTTLLSLILAAIFMVGSLLTALWVSSLIEVRLLRDATGSSLSLRKIASNGIRAFFLFVALVTGLKVVNIDLTVFSVFGGALGVGIGLGLQKLAANYVSGFVVLLERSVRIGDMIRIDGFEGRVTDISARFTRLRSTSGIESILPNDMLVNLRVENSSLMDPQVWHSVDVSVGYDSDVELVQRLLLDAAWKQPRVQRDPPPTANLFAFGDNGLMFRLGFWISDPEKSTLALRSAINLQILRSLREHNINIPFPQRVVHTVTPADDVIPPPSTDAGKAESATPV